MHQQLSRELFLIVMFVIATDQSDTVHALSPCLLGSQIEASRDHAHREFIAPAISDATESGNS
jgi:hypothetical protein